MHVEDVADAAVHLMEKSNNTGAIFNVAVNPITYEDAFKAYIKALSNERIKYLRLRLLGHLSSMVERRPGLKKWLSTQIGSSFAFHIWKPGFDMVYSSENLLQTSFRFRWNEFEQVIASCLKADGKARNEDETSENAKHRL